MNLIYYEKGNKVLHKFHLNTFTHYNECLHDITVCLLLSKLWKRTRMSRIALRKKAYRYHRSLKLCHFVFFFWKFSIHFQYLEDSFICLVILSTCSQQWSENLRRNLMCHRITTKIRPKKHLYLPKTWHAESSFRWNNFNVSITILYLYIALSIYK